MGPADNAKKRTPRRPAASQPAARRTTRRSSTKALADAAAGERVTEEILRLAEEQLKVDKRVVETGRVRVKRTTTKQKHKVDLPLTSQTAEVHHVPVNKPIKKWPQVRETRTEIIIPIVEEVLVVERRLMLREEVRIKKVRSVERHTEEVVLRVQKATVQRVATKNSGAGSTARTERPTGSRRSAKQPPQPRRKRS